MTRSDQLVGVLHLLDRFLAPLLGERLVAPIVEQPVMQPVLVDRRQFVPQRLIEKSMTPGSPFMIVLLKWGSAPHDVWLWL